MILLNFFIGFFAIFVAPQIFLYYKYKHLPYSLTLLYGLILSYTGAWLTLLLTYYLNLSSSFVYILASFITLSSLLYIGLHKRYFTKSYHGVLVWFLVFIMMLPLLKNIGVGYSIWDVLASWNKWAMELYHNEYHPINAAYPILMPGIWSLIYKIQGTDEIWWTAQIINFALPIMTLGILLTLYTETKNRTYLWIVLFIYPYLFSIHTINGNMDMPVMIMGTLSLISLYTAEQYKGKKEFVYYVYASLLLSGIDSITKQSGFVFLVFDFIYILINIKFFRNKKMLMVMMSISLLYSISYLIMYYQQSSVGIIGNLHHLKDIAHQKYLAYNFNEYIQWLFNRFFQLPETISFFVPLLSFLKIKYISPILIIIGLLLFIFKDLRRYHSISFLSAIFFIVGTLIWIKFFSYDERNALWVKSFFIIFLSINLNYLLTRYKYKYRPLYTKILFFLILFIVSLDLYALGDKFAYAKQKNSQMQAGVRYGCLPSIQYAVKLLKDKSACVKIYTNELPMLQNYRLKPYEDRFILIGRDYKFQSFQYLKHTCKEGRYIIFRKASILNKDEWWKVEKLTKEGMIKPIPNNKNVLVYFVPPNLKLGKYYFKNTKIVPMQIGKYKENIAYAIDTISKKNNLFTIQGWAYIKNAKIDKTIKYILLKNTQNSYVIATNIRIRNDVTQHFKAKDLAKSGFSTDIYTEDFPKGVYEIYILLEDKNKTQYLTKTKRMITIE